MKNLQRMILALCLGASSANAAVITQTELIPLRTPGSSLTQLSFDQFDSVKENGTLDSIQIIYNLYIYGGSLAVDNDSTDPQSGLAHITLTTSLSSLTVSLINSSGLTPWTGLQSDLTELFNLAGTSGDDIDNYNATGDTDWDQLNGPTSANPTTLTGNGFVNNYFFGGYEGTGTYTINASALQSSYADMEGGIAYAVVQQQVYGSVTVIYNYTPIPEPATASLAGFGLLLLIRRRRKA